MRPAVVLLLLLALAAPALALAAPQEKHVDVMAATFEDDELGRFATRVKAGGAVIWTWQEGTHSVTAGAWNQPLVAPAFDSGLLETTFDPVTGEPATKFSVRFDLPGTYHYYCRLHWAMRAQIVVEP